jgi:3'-5' exoribonuclease Rv2179c-like domain
VTAKYTDVMLDLETLGIAPGSVILSIGAVAFTEKMAEEDWGRFDSGPISVVNSRACGLTIDEDTLAWWLRQEPAARTVLDRALTGGATVLNVLTDFVTWFPPGAKVWGNGANFDNILFRVAFAACDKWAGINVTPPWKYYDDMCFRTMKNTFRCVPAPAFQGVKHDALTDALHQTRWLQAIWAHLGERGA